jgi:hypothetical protein
MVSYLPFIGLRHFAELYSHNLPEEAISLHSIAVILFGYHKKDLLDDSWIQLHWSDPPSSSGASGCSYPSTILIYFVVESGNISEGASSGKTRFNFMS